MDYTGVDAQTGGWAVGVDGTGVEVCTDVWTDETGVDIRTRD